MLLFLFRRYSYAFSPLYSHVYHLAVIATEVQKNIQNVWSELTGFFNKPSLISDRSDMQIREISILRHAVITYNRMISKYTSVY